MKKVITPTLEKGFLTHILKNEEYIEKIELEFFNNKDISLTYQVIKDFYKKNNSIPTIDKIYEDAKIIKPEINQQLIKTILKEDIYENYMKENKDYFLNEFEYNYKLLKITNETLKIVDTLRNPNEVLIKSLSDKLGIESLTEEDDDDEEENKTLENTPLINDNVFETLPKTFKDMFKYIKDKRERDVFFLSQSTVFSYLLDNISTVYYGKEIFPNLSCFIVAPPASGKGTMTSSINTINKLQKELNKDLKNIFVEPVDPTEEITTRIICIPANTSHAKFIDMLKDNGGKGLLWASEADEMVTAYKQDWGNYSSDLRKAAHHETVQLARKITKDNPKGLIVIETPKLSVCISGTNDQVFKLIESSGNGLFSRYFFYAFGKEPTFNRYDMFDKPDLGYEYREIQGSKILDLYNFYKDKKINFKLTDQQQNVFIETLKCWLNESVLLGKDYENTIIRHAVRLLRFMMIFSAIRKFDERDVFFGDDDNFTELICNDIDFNSSISIINVLNYHSKIIFTNLNNSLNKEIKKDPFEEVFDNLNGSPFKSKDYLDKVNKLGKKCDIKTIQRKIKKLIETGQVIKIEGNKYRKVYKT